VIRGVVRLACDAASDLELMAEGEFGATAVAVVLGAVPDVAVLDIDLPDRDGLGVLRDLRDAGFAGAVLVLTDRDDGSSLLEAMRLGAAGYLGKANGLRQVARAIRRVASGERVVDPELEELAVGELGRFARRAREGREVGAVLTAREQEILELLADGLTMQQIARRLAISPRTVETHVAKLYRKLAVRTRVQAVARAMSLGLVDLR
jgi:DNA-binding NarL/FixJ family response regulator